MERNPLIWGKNIEMLLMYVEINFKKLHINKMILFATAYFVMCVWGGGEGVEMKVAHILLGFV